MIIVTNCGSNDVEPRHNFVAFSIPDGGVCEPADLKSLEIPKVDCSRGVVISGKGPTWVFSFLSHEFHVCAWIANHDPRLNGAVVTQSHVKDVHVGDIVPVF